MKKINCLVLLFNYFIFVVISAQSEQCVTPNNTTGICKNIRQCVPLREILRNRPMTANHVAYLRASQCGFENLEPKVCCPPSGQSDAVTNYSSENVQTNCGRADTSKIYKQPGTAAELDEYPWMALLEYQTPAGNRSFHCGGVLISKRYVLTAAHCVRGKFLPENLKLIGVRLGEFNINSQEDCIEYGAQQFCADPAINIAINETIVHEGYDGTNANLHHDIALLKLCKDVQFTDFVQPICLPTEDPVTQPLQVAGWGKTRNSSKQSNVLLQGPVFLKNHSECTDGVLRHQICAGVRRGKELCVGDSGGPLMGLVADKEGEVSWAIVGVEAYASTPCGFEDAPRIYTSVKDYLKWIVGKMR